MHRDINRLKDGPFDLLVVGGGIHGVCVARDAAHRGLKVALIERDDFGAATSHNSLKLVHGGFRYLQHSDLRRLRQSVRERRYWLWAAPHLVRPLKFVMPLYGHTTRGPEALWIASQLYRLLSMDRNRGLGATHRVPNGGIVSKAACQGLIPGVESTGLSGATYWYDGQILDADRLLLDCLSDAAAQGAVAANYVEATGFLGDAQQVQGVRAVDRLTGAEIELQARLTVNTCGPWIDKLLHKGLELRRDGMTGLSKCMNLVTRPLTEDHAFGVRSSRASDALLGRERRMFFFTPWQDRTVIGTSHLPYQGDPDTCRYKEQDVAEFLEEINAAYPRARLKLNDVDYCYGGLTPAEEESAASGEVARARRSEVLDHRESHGVDGLMSAVGVKWTTSRLVAENLVDQVMTRLGRPGVSCRLHEAPLPGAKRAAAPEPSLPDLCRNAVEEDMARHLSDLVFRRTSLSHRGAFDESMLVQSAAVMAEELGWDSTEQARELDTVRSDGRWHLGKPQPSPQPRDIDRIEPRRSY